MCRGIIQDENLKQASSWEGSFMTPIVAMDSKGISTEQKRST